jgi:chromosome segregation ATPase
LEENVVEYKKKIEKLEDKVNLCSEEIKKGNEIIEKFQADIAQQKQKTKMKNSLIQSQEESINKFQADNDKLNKVITESKHPSKFEFKFLSAKRSQ